MRFPPPSATRFGATLPRCLTFAALLVFAALTLAWSHGPAAADTSEAALALDQKLIEEAKASSEIMTNLTYLSDVIGPRLTGSPALKRANEWTAEKMKSYGLTNVRLEPWTIPVGWERGTAYAKVVEPPNGRTLLLASMGWAPGTKGKVEGDVVYVKATSQKELEPYKGKLRNAIVLGSPPANVRPITEAAPASSWRSRTS